MVRKISVINVVVFNVENFLVELFMKTHQNLVKTFMSWSFRVLWWGDCESSNSISNSQSMNSNLRIVPGTNILKLSWCQSILLIRLAIRPSWIIDTWSASTGWIRQLIVAWNFTAKLLQSGFKAMSILSALNFEDSIVIGEIANVMNGVVERRSSSSLRTTWVGYFRLTIEDEYLVKSHVAFGM